MVQVIDLKGSWNFCLDTALSGLEKGYSAGGFSDTMILPGTTAQAKKGKRNTVREIGHLTEEYAFTGYAWFEKDFVLESGLAGGAAKLFLERTRISSVWLDGKFIDSQNSLCSPHIHELGADLKRGKHKLVVMIDNTSYPTKGGHMTSPDTQTNWNGIVGAVEIRIFPKVYMEHVWLYPSLEKQGVFIKINIHNLPEEPLTAYFKISASTLPENPPFQKAEAKYYQYQLSSGTDILELFYPVDNPLYWDEYSPNVYKLEISMDALDTQDKWDGTFGFRNFCAGKNKFFINGEETFLRGKHDGMIFPLTGYAPAEVKDWIKVMSMAKKYGINHYRFHTCCPPEAAFCAADLLGIYMEPELPFWGTVTDETYEDHNREQQAYLIEEGKRILKTFGNHPSFVMMSLGNELWGSKTRIRDILRIYKEMDPRHLYTQGSNNFQFIPEILDEDDFFVGVRFDRDRLFRGSYAMCDAPLGHVQTMEPGTLTDYDSHILPPVTQSTEYDGKDKNIRIQFHDHTVQVKASGQKETLIPRIPVISHEIGQYETYPNYREIEKYTGVLKPENLKIFKQRLDEKGLGDLADAYFKASGMLAAACYKEELEAAFRTRYLAGFQLLDLQDFSGQGTALIGVLDAFMEEKGLISAGEWRSFCSDTVLLGRFSKYNYISGETFKADIQISYYNPAPLPSLRLVWKLIRVTGQERSREGVTGEDDLLKTEAMTGYIKLPGHPDKGLTELGTVSAVFPRVTTMSRYRFLLSLEGTSIQKEYQFCVYPETVLNLIQVEDYQVYVSRETYRKVYVLHEFGQAAFELLKKGENIILIPSVIKHGLPGFYCTDFWCYPMFRSISENMNKEVPAGTMGLLINKEHKALNHFPGEIYSTPQWYKIVTNSTAVILDDTLPEYRPIVQVIDNFERNHKLGLLFEARISCDNRILNGNLLVCTSRLEELVQYPETAQFFYSILEYAASADFTPDAVVDAEFFEMM